MKGCGSLKGISSETVAKEVITDFRERSTIEIVTERRIAPLEQNRVTNSTIILLFMTKYYIQQARRRK
ncbi:hypothetical protein [Cytobacillus kochii]|uniref:hypothetical protein n=1 Tax=Cytobacillus kochii TaxID=859143 RepID=UPI00203F7AEC|nr:hypothetical protein [Cytobacillus kochii]MCM3324397.1 hypothetical protein [Cytobacillus kochii]MCM3346791.1 hypothetical protein [Cytobacillus kochii]